MSTQPKPVPPEHAKTATPDDPALQGEGNYTAARRHRKSVKQFIESGQVDEAARDAEPDSSEEARELLEAERQGLAHARK